MVLCQHCSAVIPADHTAIGMTMKCPHCSERTILKYAHGNSIPPTGWSLTFAEFARLVDDDSSRQRIGPMMERWFEGRISSLASPTFLRKRDGSLVTKEDAHLAIQNDAPKQYELYQAAMDLWR